LVQILFEEKSILLIRSINSLERIRDGIVDDFSHFYFIV